MADKPMTSTVSEQEVVRASVQIRIPKPIWDRMKIQAIREDITAEELAAKAFEAYLGTNEPRTEAL